MLCMRQRTKKETGKSFTKLNGWDNKSRVKGDFQARFCERLGLKCPCLLDSLAEDPAFLPGIERRVPCRRPYGDKTAE